MNNKHKREMAKSDILVYWGIFLGHIAALLVVIFAESLDKSPISALALGSLFVAIAAIVTTVRFQSKF